MSDHTSTDDAAKFADDELLKEAEREFQQSLGRDIARWKEALKDHILHYEERSK